MGKLIKNHRKKIEKQVKTNHLKTIENWVKGQKID